MNRPSLEARVETIDRRLDRVEQILPTLATKEDLKAFATKDDLKAYPTRVELRVALEEQRKAIMQDMRVLFEEQQQFIRVLAEGIQACDERVDRVDAASRARDAALDRRLTDVERQA